jgi:hypothetical protein
MNKTSAYCKPNIIVLGSRSGNDPGARTSKVTEDSPKPFTGESSPLMISTSRTIRPKSLVRQRVLTPEAV